MVNLVSPRDRPLAVSTITYVDTLLVAKAGMSTLTKMATLTKVVNYTKIRKGRLLLELRGYEVRPIGADASNRNGPVERSHQTVCNTSGSVLSVAGLDAKLWPYAF
jgi:hypothetical protein